MAIVRLDPRVSQPVMGAIPYFVSWRGGKDSSLALFRAMQQYGKPRYLLTMLTEDAKRSRSHGIAREVKKEGIEVGVFGDIKIPNKPDYMSHRRCADSVCHTINLTLIASSR